MKKETKNLLEQAKIDLNTSRNSLNSRDFYASVFWCQQTIEKSLKSVLMEKKSVLLKIHDLVILGKRVNLPKEFLEHFKELNEGYIDSRYGGAGDKLPSELFDDKDAKKFIKIAEEVLEWVKKKI